MPKLRIIADAKEPVEIGLAEIDPKLNEVLKDALHFTSPGYIPSVEHPSDERTGYFPAGSEVFVPKHYAPQYIQSQIGNNQEHVTYTFKVFWDENLSGHDTDKHWNIKIYKTIHAQTGIARIDEYALPNVENLDHIKDASWIRIELADDNGRLISSKQFEKST